MWDIIAGVGATLAAAGIGAYANTSAADKVAEAERERTAMLAEANQQSQARLDRLESQTEPGMNYLRNVVAGDPTTLTPYQQKSLDTSRQNAIRTLSASGLRGSGRAITEGVRDVESGFYGDLVQSNIARADRAAGGLADTYVGAVGDRNRYDYNTASGAGSSIARSADASAGASLANASLAGDAIGTIGSLIASDRKDRTRESKYEDDVKKMTTP